MKPNDTRQVSAFDEICISCRFFTGTECNQRKGLRKKPDDHCSIQSTNGKTLYQVNPVYLKKTVRFE